jgi:two-component sensor histidine kinase
MAHRIWLGLLPLMLATGVEAQVADLDAFVAAKAAALEVLHRKAERALVAVAQDSSYREYFKARSDHHRQELKERIDRISLEAQSKFDVGEMCLINENGHEISRIVEGEVAHDLSTEEATAIFFEPAFALAPRNVYVSPIYMSPDVHRWVVGYVTPIEVDGEKKAILHYEHDLETYQDLLAEGLSGDDDRFLLAVNEEGWINNQWDIPRLRELLLEILPQRETVEAFEVEHAFEDIGEKIMLLSARRLQRAEDRPSLILVAIEDVTERRRSRWLLEHHKELAEKIVDTVPEPLLVLSEVLPGNEFFEDFEVEHDFPTLGRRTMLLNARRVDHLQLILLAIEDVTERRRAEREREMLVGELNHRVKNSFALMRALVTQGNGARSAEEYRKVLLGRMDALARTHDLLFESHWQGADMRSLARALQPFAAEGTEAIELEGVAVRLEARQSLSVSLVLHELATNAAKYGVLSVPEGRVRLSWQVERADDGRHLRLLWQERGGPPVTAPLEPGFGTELIRRPRHPSAPASPAPARRSRPHRRASYSAARRSRGPYRRSPPASRPIPGRSPRSTDRGRRFSHLRRCHRSRHTQCRHARRRARPPRRDVLRAS